MIRPSSWTTTLSSVEHDDKLETPKPARSLGIGDTSRSRVVTLHLWASGDREALEKGDIWEDGQGGKWVGGEDTTVVAMPGVLRYLDVELSAMGVKMKFNITP